MKIATFSFIPMFCPSCGYRIAKDITQSMQAMNYYLAGAKILCPDCGTAHKLDDAGIKNVQEQAQVQKPPDILETGYFAVYGKPPSLVHVTNNRIPICGSKTDPKEFQWCAQGIVEQYVTCRTCQSMMFKLYSDRVVTR